MLALSIESPFAACRNFTAGWYRPTATFLTPSMIYGLLLNLAGIEGRLCEESTDHPGTVPASLTRSGLPAIKLAFGVPLLPREQQPSPPPDPYPSMQTIYQQLHNYPVGTSGSDRADSAFGSKYNITPVRREFLYNVRAVAIVDGNLELENQVRGTLQHGPTSPRYGLPFLGDNSFLPDRIDILDALPLVHWYERVTERSEGLHPRTARLTIWIDRADSSRTMSDLFAPTKEATSTVPERAWVDIQPPG